MKVIVLFLLVTLLYNLNATHLSTTLSEEKQLCTVCILAVNQLHRFLSESEEIVIRNLLQTCDLLPERMVPYCRMAVNIYGKDLIQEVRKYIGQPRDFCTNIKLCSDRIEIVQPKNCFLCVMGVTEAINQVKKNEEFILDTLQNYTRDAGVEVVRFIKQQINSPIDVCTTFGACPRDPQICEMCTIVISQARRMLDESEHEIVRRWILIPLRPYKKELFDYLVSQLDAQELCKYFGVCTLNISN
jgi:hypothetical protein